MGLRMVPGVIVQLVTGGQYQHDGWRYAFRAIRGESQSSVRDERELRRVRSVDRQLESVLLNLWQQSRAGISVFVSSGDSGSAGCDASSSTTGATHGLAINGLGSTPHNTAVGGTMFNDSVNNGYWSASQSTDGHRSSALGYIPVNVWKTKARSARDSGRAAAA